MDIVEKRRNFIINIFYFALIIGLFYLFFKYLFGICFPFLLAVFVSTVLQRPINFLVKKSHIPRGIVSTILVLFCFLVVGTIVVLIVMKLFTEMKSFFDFLMLKLDNIPLLIEQISGWLSNHLTFIPETIRNSSSAYIADILNKVFGTAGGTQAVLSTSVETSRQSFDLQWLASPIGAVWGTAKQIPMIAVGILVAIVSGCFIASDYSSLREIVLKLAGKTGAVKIIKTKKILFTTLGKIGKAYMILIAVTFTEMMIGLSFLKVIGLYTSGYVLAISLVTAIVDILPVLGTGTILVPWGVWSLISGNIGFGIGILVLYAIITVIRQIIEPKLVAAQLGLPAFVTITAMYIGTQLFGFIGLFLLPISIMLLKVLNDEGIINIFKKEPVDVTDVETQAEFEIKEVEVKEAEKEIPEKKKEKKPFFNFKK